MKPRLTSPAWLLIALALTVVACERNEATGGLSKQDFEAIIEISGDGFRKGYLGLTVADETLGGTVVMPSGARAKYSGSLSPDPEERWLKVDWSAARDDCDEHARFHLELAWASLSALTGTGELTVRCGEDAPATIEIIATLLWDPRYAP